ncbi:hypothetical protein KO500_08235 [Cellulophaga baltica]|uniref:hypothetical protein n=1 Tax=Cellulophaga TaxID=104264 RepID=UPI001C0744FC|nr:MULTISPECIES: hypothetical protein [Cellulophaga]MBU2996420.1 hypothetical protein [Cellulophaga baltica]MDO6767816.1 hypothetical protein [Cellulophaga sp. 1_MG-2023]
MSKKSELYHLISKEKRDSRIKETRNFILEKTNGSLLNNQKWYRIFEWIEQHHSEFELKTLLSSEIKKADHIFELEKSSILIDNSGNFIEFLELEQIILKNKSELKVELKKLNVEFLEQADFIEINGYRK